jgi:hypothetical protein
MRKICASFLLTPAIASLLVFLPLPAFAQDSPSLGDAARLARQQKQQKEAQANDTATKDPTNKDTPPSNLTKPNLTKKTPKSITNEEIPEHIGPAAHPAPSDAAYHDPNRTQPAANSEQKGEALRSQIAEQKSQIASLQSSIDGLNDSIHFTTANCVANCVQWNERQVEKQQVEQMKAQLEDMKKRLEDTQESARRQGFGSSVYDP